VRAGPGAVSAMGYATRLHNSLVQAVVMSVSAVLLPHFARQLASGEEARLRSTLERVFAAALLFALGGFVLVAAGGESIIRVLMERGSFTATDAQAVARVWLALTVGLFGATWGIFLVRLFQAQRRIWFVFGTGCLSILVNVSLAHFLLPLWGVAGIALANSFAYTLVMLVCHVRADQFLGRILSRRSASFFAAALFANGVAYIGATWWGGLFGQTRPATVVAGQIVLVAFANILVARAAPLRMPLLALVRA
jgi:peptidoglycan biosynthesis protein MviN/MurJ (putative lipid II flippase)